MQESIDELNRELTSTPLSPFQEYEQQLLVKVHTSSVAVGGVMTEKKENIILHPVQLSSPTMNTSECSFLAGEREASAVVFCVEETYTLPFFVSTV